MNSDSNEWVPYGFNDTPEDKDVFVEFLMRAQDISRELAECMFEELQETREEKHNVIFVASNGELSIKAIHVPESALGGSPGPVLFSTSKPLSIIAAFSKETIQHAMELLDGVDPGLAERLWVQLLETMTEAITIEYETNPPKWEMGN